MDLSKLNTLIKERDNVEQKIKDCYAENTINLISANPIITQESYIKNDWCEQKKRVSPNMRRIPPKTSAEESISITNNISLPAIKVQTFAEVLGDGKLYYVEFCNHFAMYILGYLYHGNIGNIYTNEKTPIKIKNCHHHNREYNTIDKCNYYHDPTIFSNSKDVRNYVASAWSYNRENATDIIKRRRFGSYENLNEDLKHITPDEISKYRDMVFHDLLCSMILLG
jgi:hypothetical protein